VACFETLSASNYTAQNGRVTDGMIWEEEEMAYLRFLLGRTSKIHEDHHSG
jgi:hypothetical protein